MRSLLAHATPADIRTDPFPHIVIPDVLEADLYAELAAGFPTTDRIVPGASDSRGTGNRRYVLSTSMVMMLNDMPDCWKRFATLHSGPDFLAQVAALFDGHWQPAMLAALDGHLTGHPTALVDLTQPPAATGLEIRQDARLEINTPVRDRPSSARGPHLDTANRLFSGLFYLRAPDDDSQGGELCLYRWRDGMVAAAPFDYQLPEAAVEEVVRIPYRANQLVLFPQSIHALHGVGARWPTPHTRRYVFITAEMNRDWLAGPGEPT
ncbi:2OG-Fe(II) oxygenase [Niveispirillum sp. KHB5.9]|uniref:2OG-Fe(II) oxygenase n=1 Tax=Niveispirillum sp. KHB5.9 TaxID=3400269 RepID=UPI003A8624BA